MKAAFAVILLLASLGCTSAISTAYRTLESTAAGLTASAKAFEQFDHDHQMALVAEGKKTGKSPAAIEDALQAYRGQRAGVLRAFSDAGAVIVAGRALLPLIEAGARHERDLNAWLESLLRAAADVRTALGLIGAGG